MSDTISSRSTSTSHSSQSLSSPPHSSLSLSSSPPKDSQSSLSSPKTSQAKLTPTPLQTAGSKLADKIQESFLVCRLCFESYKLPKCLSCLHTFCESCLENLLQQNELSAAYRKYSTTEYRDLACPICRKRTPIPLGGVRRLPDNFLIEGLSETLVRQRPSKSPQCDICKLLGKTAAEASAKCLECQRLMCQDCVALHRQTRVTSGHSLFDVEIEKEIECQNHKDEVVRFYCETCSSCICIMCTFNEHRDHDISAFQEAASKHHAKIQQMATVCKNNLSVSERELEALECCESLMKSVEQFIRTKAEEMRQELNYREKQLVGQLKDLYGDECLERIASKKDMIIQMDECKSTCKLVDVVLSGKEIEFLLLRKKVEDKLEEINKMPKTKLPKTVEKVVQFRPGTLSFGVLYDYDEENVNKTTKKLKTKSVSFDDPNSDGKCATPTTTATTTSDSVVNLSMAATTPDRADVAITSKSRDTLRAEATVLSATASKTTNAATSTAAATTDQSILKLVDKNSAEVVDNTTTSCGKAQVHLRSVDTQTDPIDWKKVTGKSTKQKKSSSVDGAKKKSDLTSIKEIENKEMSSLAASQSSSAVPPSISVSRPLFTTSSNLASVLSSPATVISPSLSSSASISVSQTPVFSSTVVSITSKTSSSLSSSNWLSPIPPFSSLKVSSPSETSSSASSASISVSPIPPFSSAKISSPSKKSSLNLISQIPPFLPKVSPLVKTTTSSSTSTTTSSTTSSSTTLSSTSSSISSTSLSTSSLSSTASTSSLTPAATASIATLSLLTKSSPSTTSQQQIMKAGVNLLQAQQLQQAQQPQQTQQPQHSPLTESAPQLHQEQTLKAIALSNGNLSSSKLKNKASDNDDKKAGKKLKNTFQGGDRPVKETTTSKVTTATEVSLCQAATSTILSTSPPAAPSTSLLSTAAISTILSTTAATTSTILSSTVALATLVAPPLPSSTRVKSSSKKKSLELALNVAEPAAKMSATVAATSSKVANSTSVTSQQDTTELKSQTLLPQISSPPPATLVNSTRQPISTPKLSPTETPSYPLKPTIPKILPQQATRETGTPSIQVVVSPTRTTPIVFKSSQTLPLSETSSPSPSVSSLSSPSLLSTGANLIVSSTSECKPIPTGTDANANLQPPISLAPTSQLPITPAHLFSKALPPAPQSSAPLSPVILTPETLSPILIAAAPISSPPISSLLPIPSSTLSLSVTQSLPSLPSSSSSSTKIVDQIHQLAAPDSHTAITPAKIALQSSLSGGVSISLASPVVKDSEKSFPNIISPEATEPSTVDRPRIDGISTNTVLSSPSSSLSSEAPSSESSSVATATTTTLPTTKTPATTVVSSSSQMALSPFPPQQPIANNSPTTPTTKVIATVAPTISVMASPLSSSLSSTKTSSPLTVSSPTALASGSTTDKTSMPTIDEDQLDSSKIENATISTTTSDAVVTEAEASSDQTATTAAGTSGENVVYRRRRRKRENEMTHLADSPLFNHRLSLGGSYQGHHLYSSSSSSSSSSFLRHSHVPQTSSSFYSSVSPGSAASSSLSYSAYTGSHRRSDGSLYSYHKFL